MPATAELPIRTLYYHFDQQGVIFNMWYLGFAEEGRNAFLEANGYSLTTLEADGFEIQVVHAEVDWRKPVLYGEPLRVQARAGKVGRTSFGLVFDMVVGTEVRATSSAVYVIVRADLTGKAPLPERLRRALTDGRSSG